MTTSENAGPLAGIRVVELATVLMVPYAAQMLGDMGADVIKVEGDRMDIGRQMGGGPHEELSGMALNLQRNKRSVRLELKGAQARDALLRLLGTADVFVTNLKPATLRKLGLDAGTVLEGRPRLIYCEAHGFATDSPEADRPAFDDVIQAETGLSRLRELVGGEVGFLPAVLADKIAAMYVTQAVLGALVHRQATGRGQRVEVPMFDAVLAFNLAEHLAQAAVPGGRVGYRRILTPHRGPHRTADGHVALLPYADADWRAVYTAAGRVEELERPVFASAKTRHADPDTVYGSLAGILAERTTGEWLELSRERAVPAARVSSLQEIVDDPELHRGVLREAEHPVTGTYRQIRPPVRYEDSPMSVRRHAPLVGEHTADVLAEAGLTREEIAAITGDQP
ncbi:MAG: CoA transferase [Streptosporangiales bacterium]|nr:CoA transferase [Streptosporangiales bacterium]